MYYCQDCGCEFQTAEILIEGHGFNSPPLERIAVCPQCHSGNFYEKTDHHCRCCGARLPAGRHDYCSEDCRINGRKLWEKERKRRHIIQTDPISVIIREADAYNKEHGTDYSYGQYMAFIRPEKAALL